jgi:hypothetical protein
MVGECPIREKDRFLPHPSHWTLRTSVDRVEKPLLNKLKNGRNKTVNEGDFF